VSIEVFKKRVGRLIRSARDQSGLRQDDVAERVGETVTKSLLSRYETGSVLPGFERLKEVLAACGVDSVPPLIEAGYREVYQEEPNSYGQVFATESAKEFIEVWLRLRSIHAVAEALGIHHSRVRWYAARLRKQGVKLPRANKLPRRKPKEDIAALRDFLEAKLLEEQPDDSDEVF
jgi:transcriptional regulator with XRE-family HTH domain